MFIPVHISQWPGLDLRLNIPTGFDYEVNWNSLNGGTIYLDDKKISLPQEEDNDILNLTYKICSSYFLKKTGVEIRVNTYELAYADHIAAAVMIKETAKKFNYPDEWAIRIFEKIFTGHVFEQPASYMYAILKEREGEFYFNEQDHSLQHAELLKDQGKLIIKTHDSFSIIAHEAEKEKVLKILTENHLINWITTLNNLHMMTGNKKLDAFLDALRSNELTTLALPVTDGWNYLIIVYFYRHKSKRMQDLVTQLYEKYLGHPPVFIG